MLQGHVARDIRGSCSEGVAAIFQHFNEDRLCLLEQTWHRRHKKRDQDGGERQGGEEGGREGVVGRTIQSRCAYSIEYTSNSDEPYNWNARRLNKGTC